jgi:predicted dehydrogenase
MRFGILGFGIHAEQRIVPALARASRTRLHGIYRRAHDKAECDAQRWNIQRVYREPEEMCSDPEIDVVFVASPDALHSTHVMMALSGRKAVLCEKPLAMSLAEANMIRKMVRATALPFGVAHNYRFGTVLPTAKLYLQTLPLGSPVVLSAEICMRAEVSRRKWLNDPLVACGGCLADLGVHCIDAIRFLLGTEPEAVACMLGGDAEAKVEQTGIITMRFPSGAIATVSASFQAAARSKLEIACSDGSIYIPAAFSADLPTEIIARRNNARSVSERVSNRDCYTEMIARFCDYVEGTGEFPSDIDNAVGNQIVLQHAYEQCIAHQ